jgi:plastocyanin
MRGTGPARRSVGWPAAPALLALLALAGCGGTAATSATGGTSASDSTSSTAATTPGASSSPSSSAGVTLPISVRGSTVTPAPSTVNVSAGEPVRLVLTSDRTSEVHVHVVDIEKPITAGVPLTLTFTPTQPGVYEVELHDPDLLLVKLAVR